MPWGGSIPACAGEPCANGLTRPTPGVYPRVCGGTRDLRRSGAVRRVYPRVCGGTPSSPSTTPAGRGLSPRVRGNPSFDPPVAHFDGSIPACAGEPAATRPTSKSTWVYPRVCGGTRGYSRNVWLDEGLSPRVRGNLETHALGAEGLGSIPACAGEPDQLEMPLTNDRVYPRVCGGTRAWCSNRPRMKGLSPRVRGNHQSPHVQARQLGSIPACAGEPPPAPARPTGSWVYPRVCGGTLPQHLEQLHDQGLSPRVRGNRGRSRRR